MAAVAGPGLCGKGTQSMSQKQRQANWPVTDGKRPRPVRVRLQVKNYYEVRPYPPDGQNREWWQRLKNALGTASSDFVYCSLMQLIAAAKLPGGRISEMAVSSSLAFIETAKPRDEIESALLIQMACTHTAAMRVLATFDEGHGCERNALRASAASRLLRAYATQVETLRRLRNGGSQLVRVEHVHVNEGGQAVIGNLQPTTGPCRLDDPGNG